MFVQSEFQCTRRAVATASMLWLAFFGSTPYAIAAGDVIPLSAANRKALSPLGKGVVGHAVPAQPIADPIRLFGLKPGVWTYEITSGASQDQTEAEILSRIPATARGATWKRVIGKEYIQHLKTTRNHDIFLTSEAVEHHELLAHFEPDVLVLSAGMKPGESRSFETKINVSKLQNPTSKEYKGHLKATTTYEGAYKVTTPAGTFNAVLFKTDYRVDVGLVKVQDTHYVFYADGVGKVAAIEGMRVSALLLYHTHTRTAKVLLSHPALGK